MTEYFKQTSTNKGLNNNRNNLPLTAIAAAMLLGTFTSVGVVNLPSYFADTGRLVNSIITPMSAETNENVSINMEVAKPKVYGGDPEILALSNEQIKAEALALNGAWANREDINDEWLDNLRSGWEERLNELYGPDNKSLTA